MIAKVLLIIVSVSKSALDASSVDSTLSSPCNGDFLESTRAVLRLIRSGCTMKDDAVHFSQTVEHAFSQLKAEGDPVACQSVLLYTEALELLDRTHQACFGESIQEHLSHVQVRRAAEQSRSSPSLRGAMTQAGDSEHFRQLREQEQTKRNQFAGEEVEELEIRGEGMRTQNQLRGSKAGKKRSWLIGVLVSLGVLMVAICAGGLVMWLLKKTRNQMGALIAEVRELVPMALAQDEAESRPFEQDKETVKSLGLQVASQDETDDSPFEEDKEVVKHVSVQTTEELMKKDKAVKQFEFVVDMSELVAIDELVVNMVEEVKQYAFVVDISELVAIDEVVVDMVEEVKQFEFMEGMCEEVMAGYEEYLDEEVLMEPGEEVVNKYRDVVVELKERLLELKFLKLAKLSSGLAVTHESRRS